MTVSEIQLFNIIKTRLGEKEAESLVEFVKHEVSEKLSDQKDYFASKADVSEAKADIIKWMFVFWIGQLAAFFAIIKFIL